MRNRQPSNKGKIGWRIGKAINEVNRREYDKPLPWSNLIITYSDTLGQNVW